MSNAGSPRVETPNQNAAKGLLSSELLPLSVALMLSIGLVAFEGLSVAPALPAIGADLGSAERLPWVMTVYLLASGLAIAVSGSLVDAIGCRTIYRVAIVSFVVSSFACGVSPSLEMVVVMRVLQGAAGGMIIAANGAAIGLGYPSALRSRAYAMASTVWGVLAFGGPALAAVLLSVLDWRWIFYVNVPLGLLAALLGWSRTPSKVEGSKPLQLDLKGALLIGAITSLGLVALSGVGLVALAGLAATVVSAVLYWRHAGVSEDPLIARRYFAHVPFRTLALAGGLIMAAGIGIETYLPLYLRGGRGESLALAAWSVLFLALGWTTAANLFSRLYHRISEGTVAFVGTIVIQPALVLSAAAVLLDLPLATLFFAFFAMGMGIGTTTNACITLVQAAAEEREIGRATAAHQFVRNMAVTYGTAAAGTALFVLASRLSGDPEAIQLALSSAESAEDSLPASSAVTSAIGTGFVAAHLVGLVLAFVAALAARRLVGTRSDTIGSADPEPSPSRVS